MKIILTLLAGLILAGCSLPCTYEGKAVPKADADRMRAAGMDVICPDEVAK